MRFRHAPRRESRDSIVPMINVAFLLLVFLLLTAEIAPAPPVEITLPQARTDPAVQADWVLHVAADGSLARGDRRGAAALADLPQGARVELRADAGLPAAHLAALLPQLSRAGDIVLVTVAP